MGMGCLRMFFSAGPNDGREQKGAFLLQRNMTGQIKTPFGRGVEVGTPSVYQQQPQLPLSDLQGPCWREREAGQAGAWVEGVRG